MTWVQVPVTLFFKYSNSTHVIRAQAGQKKMSI